MSLLDTYTSLTPSASRIDVSKALQTLVDAPLFGMEEDVRKKLVQALLDDLAKLKKGKESGRLSAADAAQALSALKALGKNKAGAQVLASAQNLSFLLSLTEHYKDNVDASCEALRCVANTMLLIEEARTTVIGDTVKGGEHAAQLLQKSSSPDLIFLASRILFLSTASSVTAGSFITSLVEDRPSSRNMTVVDIIALRLDSLLISLLAGTKMAREAMIDLLKFTYNLLAHYPKLADCEKVTDLGAGEEKVMTEYWSDRLDALLPALLRAFNALPPPSRSPIAPPLSHVIHGLIAIPITPTLRTTWFPAEQRRSGSGSHRASPTQSPGNLHGDSPKESRPGALDRALNMLSASRRSLSSRPSSPNPPSPPTQTDTVQRAIDLLDVGLAHYFPDAVDVDDMSVRSRAKDEQDSTIDELLAPITMLCTKFALADSAARARLKEWLVPANLDRTHSLEGRADALGRVLRLLQSVHHPRMKAMCGEMLFAMCNSDSMQLIQAVGYGNVAGFLFNKGIVTAPPQTSSVDSSSGDEPAINPITGAVQESRPVDDEMTEEEREAEAERLFVLFDRLERSGAIPPNQNPIRRAAAEGYFG